MVNSCLSARIKTKIWQFMHEDTIYRPDGGSAQPGKLTKQYGLGYLSLALIAMFSAISVLAFFTHGTAPMLFRAVLVAGSFTGTAVTFFMFLMGVLFCEVGEVAHRRFAGTLAALWLCMCVALTTQMFFNPGFSWVWGCVIWAPLIIVVCIGKLASSLANSRARRRQAFARGAADSQAGVAL